MKWIACAVLIAAGPSLIAAQVPVDRATDLARKWTIGADKPVCQSRGARGEYLKAGTQYCSWQASPGSDLGVTVQSTSALSLVTWYRGAASANDASRIVDSLSRAFTTLGLTALVCKGQTFWSTTGLAVSVDRTDSKSAPPHVLVTATNYPPVMQGVERAMSCGDSAASKAGAFEVPVDRLTDLVRKWAIRPGAPECGTRDQRGRDLPRGAHYCSWPSAAGSVLGVTFSANSGPTFALWDRHAASAADADRIVDSVGRGLIAKGLKTQPCQQPGMAPVRRITTAWTSDGLSVYLTRTDSAQAAPHIEVIATDFPGLRCRPVGRM